MAVPLNSPQNLDRFKQYAGFVFARDNAGKHVGIENYKKNSLEKTGDFFGWGLFKLPEQLFIDLPKKIYSSSLHPNVIGLASAAIAVASINYLFAPRGTAKKDLEKAALKVNHSAKALIIASISRAPHVKLAAYFFCQVSALAFISRTVGRFTNEDLMKQFKSKIG